MFFGSRSRHVANLTKFRISSRLVSTQRAKFSSELYSSKEKPTESTARYLAILVSVAGIVLGGSTLLYRENIFFVDSRTNDIRTRVAKLEADMSKMLASEKNRAFVFIKPHAVTENVEALILERFEDFGIKVYGSGTITGPQIDEELLIDNHYGAIAAKAVTISPKDLSVSEKAQEDFLKLSNGVSWEEAVSNGSVLNAKEYCSAKSVDGQQLDKKWSKLKRGKNLVKFGGGFYCGKLAENEYVINGFYMAMRDKFTGQEDAIKYFLVEFSPDRLDWDKFRNQVLGETDPSSAPIGSLRRSIFEDWKKLGLKFKPSTGHNGIHASASPFEAFAERCNWLKKDYTIESDVFGEALLKNGIPKDLIIDYLKDPTVEFHGKKHSIFDLLEDLDSKECLEKLSEIANH